MVDNLGVFIMKCHKHNVSATKGLELLKTVARLSLCVSFNKQLYNKFALTQEPQAQALLLDLTAKTLHNNPGANSISRILSAAACVAPAASELLLLTLGAASVFSNLHWLQAKKPASAEVGSTSVQEHMLHQYCTVGSAFTFGYNKNFIQDGALAAVSFTLTASEQKELEKTDDNVMAVKVKEKEKREQNHIRQGAEMSHVFSCS
jgi:hypothetical protein